MTQKQITCLLKSLVILSLEGIQIQERGKGDGASATIALVKTVVITWSQ